MNDFNPYDFDQKDEGAEARKRREERNREDIRWLMNTRQGRRFAWSQLSLAGLYRLSYQPGDTHATAFLEGQRNLGLALLARIEGYCPNEYQMMLRESLEDQLADG